MATEPRHEITESARLDNFVDGAFAFAVTMLVIGGTSIPHDIPSLVRALGRVPAFACCFLQLALFWHGHVRWRDLVSLTDMRSRMLSLTLVFFALIFVYPLHMVFASFFHFVSGQVLPMDFVVDLGDMSDMKTIFIIYGLSYTCMSGTLALLFRHGVRHAAGLAAVDRVEVGVNMLAWAFSACVGLLSAAIALAIPRQGPGWLIAFSGFSYALLSAMGPLLDRYRRRQRARISP